MEFKGDVIITDPCYIIKDNENNDWKKWNSSKTGTSSGFLLKKEGEKDACCIFRAGQRSLCR